MTLSSSVEFLASVCPSCGKTPRATPCPDCGWEPPRPIEEVDEAPPTRIAVAPTGGSPIIFLIRPPLLSPAMTPTMSGKILGGGSAPIRAPSREFTRIAAFTLILVLTLSVSFWLIQPKPAASLLSVFSEVTPALTQPEAIDEWAIKELYSGPPDEVDARIDSSREQLRIEWACLQHRFDGSNHQWEHLAALANIAQALGARDCAMLELSADLNTQIGVAKGIVGMREQSTSIALARKSFERCAQMTTAQASIARLQRKVAELDALMRSH